MAHVSEKEIEHLADLSRIEIEAEDKKSLVKDLDAILSYFEELRELSTDDIVPKTGGSLIFNALRDDANVSLRVENDIVVESFPEKEGNLLKIPPVFEK